MTGSDKKRVETYLARIRDGLRGLPREDVDDTIEEMRTHIFEETGEQGSAAAVLAGFGDPAEVASRIVSERLRPEDGPAVPPAPLGVRYSAWATDVVIGFGPLVLVPTLISFPFVATGLTGGDRVMPIWLLLVSAVLTRWVMSPAELAEMSAVNAAIPAWQWALLAVLVCWAAFYWLVIRRRDSSSVGMWMTQLRGVRVDDERIVVRARDISQRPAPLGSGRGRWWILLGLIPTGCLCILLALYYVTMGVGAFVQPWDALATPFEERADIEREMDLVDEFVELLNARDLEGAERLVTGVDPEVLRVLVDPGQGAGFNVGGTAGDGRYVVMANLPEERVRDIYVTIEKTDVVRGHDYIESFRISEIEIGETTTAASAP